MIMPTKKECLMEAAKNAGAVMVALAIIAVLTFALGAAFKNPEVPQEVREQRLAILEGRQ